ncbi:RanBP-type and C3HC4-type zinc finger-containing protein 1 [Durusdinium trenchii]|uniref:RanBP-type and C3HC4-type zinc finger-containing protein 1 n=1 Tax=Durusdinium trenchii TaxID=1381693 RepID=A0ABP0PPR4_9DINO
MEAPKHWSSTRAQTGNSFSWILEPHLMKQLLSSYSTWARLPPSVLLKPLKSMRQEALTDEMKKRHRFLQHLPSDAAGNLIAFADGEVLAGDEGKSNGKGRKGKGRRKPREPRDGAGRERLESQESKASASFSGADGHTGSEPLASPSLAPEPEPAQEDAWSEPEKAEVAALDGPELLNDADA